MRRLLARYDHPAAITPPPDLTARVLAYLPDAAPAAVATAERRKRQRRRWLGGVGLSIIICLFMLGIWGVFVDSSGPVQLVGNAATGLGRIMLVLVLAAKPLVHVVLSPGMLLAVAALVLAATAWGWWQLVQRTPLSGSLESRT